MAPGSHPETVAGVRLVPFPADGSGRLMEAKVAAGEFDGVLDLFLGELADELFGGAMSAGPDRLFAAAMRSLPQVIAPGGLDRVRLSDGEARPLTPAECDRLGKELAQRACASNGPVAILWPTAGVDPILGQSLRNWLGSWVELVETSHQVGSPEFVAEAVALWKRIARGARR